MSDQIKKPKHKNKLEALDNMSLGISIVVAIAIGVGVGLFLKELTGQIWLLWISVAYGIAGAILNVKKAYDRAQKEFKELENDPRYKYRAMHGDNSKDNLSNDD
jgi:F0F1-type ATP synthase assembly protein I